MGAGVVDLLDATLDALTRSQREDLAVRVRRARMRHADPTCRVVVCGEFKKGKSSLVNALLAARVCATDADVATAVPTWIRYGPALEAHVLTGESPDPSPGRAGAVRVDPGGADGVATGHGGPAARGLEIRLPRQLLAGGLVLVDTPGVSGGLASSHAGIALRALASADVLVFATDAGTELGAAELEFLRQASALCPRVVGALTKIDQYPQWRRILEVDRAHLATAGLDVDVLPLSAPLRYHGLREHDRELLAESGFPRLVARLVDERARVAAATGAESVAVAVGALGQLCTELAAERAALDADGGSAQQRAAWAAARDLAADLRGAGSRWQQVLFDRTADLAADVELDLTVRMRALRREAAGRIAELPPTRLTADLGPWLQGAVMELLLDHQRVVRAHAEGLADAVTEQFGSAAWELRQGLELGTGSPGTGRVDVAFTPAAAVRMSRLDLGLVALRGGSAGAVMWQAAALLPLAVPVVLPAAVVLSTVLAGRMWHNARSAQLRALRADTERAVGAYLEEVDTVARKETRDAVRQLQRRLRESLAERAGELFTTATRSVEALAAAVEEDTEARAARRVVLDADLATARALHARAQRLLDDLLPDPVGVA